MHPVVGIGLGDSRQSSCVRPGLPPGTAHTVELCTGPGEKGARICAARLAADDDETMTRTWYSLELRPRLPVELARLDELANDLYYSWSTQVRSLFFYLDHELWSKCGHNPKLFLRRIAQQHLDDAVQDRTFMENFNLALADYDTYLKKTDQGTVDGWLDPANDVVAYFSAEFGFHESLPIYSGGLGILAGDHCKAASDLGLPLIAVGLLYRKGNFGQTIDAAGNQQVHFHSSDFAHLPIELVTNASGDLVLVHIELPGRTVTCQIWLAKAGRIRLYLLDTDAEQNEESDRTITHQLYGGDVGTRILQEIVLGIGGVRALRALGYRPTAWHINEGHAAFQLVERWREQVAEGLDFASAMEVVGASTVFTTHTPVAAGHDTFSGELVTSYMSDIASQLGLSISEFLAIGDTPRSQGGFNMTAMALRGSRHRNGVSRIHGRVASEMESYVWPQIPHDENPIRYVTNGVHVATFLAPEWRALFDMEFGQEWRNRLLDERYWQRIDQIADFNYWSVRQRLKATLLSDVRDRVVKRHERNGSNAAEIDQLIRYLSPANTDMLIVGFARRFATYKRATLLFRDIERLARLLNDPERPVLLLFAGKAHPSDFPGQALIREIHEIAQRTEFEGKIILLEDYNLALARRLVTGVDVWLNTPEPPMEASGTSGQKAGMNGVVNISVLDGWWGEAYNGRNGWAIVPQRAKNAADRDETENRALLNLIETKLIPLYFDRNGHGYSEAWIDASKESMKSILPRFNAARMVMDYVETFYSPAMRHGRLQEQNGAANARALAQWKERVNCAWDGITLRRLDTPPEEIETGSCVPIEVAAGLNELDPDDLIVECIVGRKSERGEMESQCVQRFTFQGINGSGEAIFRLDLAPPLAGLQYYQIRAYPHHPLLSHPFEPGKMFWV
jgi:starch phosphorylase